MKLGEQKFYCTIYISPGADPLMLLAEEAMYGENNSIETIEISVSEEQSLINTLTLWIPIQI